MAWRLCDSVVRGEIDNRTRNLVVGRLWLVGRDDPVDLTLKGNGHADVAGRRITFENPEPRPGEHTDLNPVQEGGAGDITVSRKVRVLDVSLEEARRLREQGETIPEHMANSIYIEWFSNFNGRVVIESADFDLTVSEPTWEMSPEQELEQAEQVRASMEGWMVMLDEAVANDDEDVDPSQDQPMSEFEWEAFLKESDQRTDKYGELMEKYRDHPDRDRMIARKMGWDWLDEALDADEKGVFADEQVNAEDPPDLVPDPLTEGTDWIQTEWGIRHPLANRASDFSVRMHHRCNELGLLGEEADPAIWTMLVEAQTLSAKLAGALNSLGYGHPTDGGFVVACLKRALVFLNNSVEASGKVKQQALLSAEDVEAYRAELFAIREEMLALMQRYREV